MIEVATRADSPLPVAGMAAGEEVVTVTVAKLLIGAAALSAVAVLVPTALAADRPDDRAGAIGVGAVSTETTPSVSIGTADTVEARIDSGLDARGSAVVPSRPDDRAGSLGVGAVVATQTTPVAPIGTADTVEARIDAGLDARGSPVVATEPIATPGTDWSDPVVVGAIAAVFALLGITVVYLIEHGRRGGGTSHRGTPGRPAATH
jgi:hypothetical protein